MVDLQQKDELGRSPNELQLRCFSRLYSHVAACGYKPDPLPVVPGRAGSELISCIDSLERFLEEKEILCGGGASRLLLFKVA